MPESIHRPALQRSWTSRAIDWADCCYLLHGFLKFRAVAPPRVFFHELGTIFRTHPYPPESHFFHHIRASPSLSHFPTINLSTSEQPTPTHSISPRPRLFVLAHQQPLSRSPFDTLNMLGPNPNLPAGSQTPQGRSATQSSTPASSGRDRATIEIVDRYLNGHNGPANGQLSTVPFPHPPLLSHSQGTFGPAMLTCALPTRSGRISTAFLAR